MQIYLDNSATTQPFPFVAEEVGQYMQRSFYNPSALYAPSVHVAQDMKAVRLQIARDLRVKEEEVILTSGGTESNNTAILGVGLNLEEPRHFITSRIEHSSVFEPFSYLQSRGHRVTFLTPNGEGVIEPQALLDALSEDTVMVSLMHVNNEIGSINDIPLLARLVKQHAPQAVFHADGVQAFPKLLCDLSQVDLYSISGHKFHAPRGTGLLIAKHHRLVHPLLLGGSQEHGMRGGTENVVGFIGLGRAHAHFQRNREQIVRQLTMLKRALIEPLSRIPDMRFNGDVVAGAPHILSVSFGGVRGEALVHALEQKGVLVGTGSACSSRNKVHRVLDAIGVPQDYAEGTIRLSLSANNTQEEIAIASQEIEQAVAYLRRFKRR